MSDESVPEYPGDWTETPSLENFRQWYEQDNNIWWMAACGHHQNLFEAALDEIDGLRDEIADLLRQDRR